MLRSRQAELQAALGEGLPADAAPAEAIERLLWHVESHASEVSVSGCPVGSLATELVKIDAQLHQPAAGLLQGLLGWLQQQFARALPAAEAQACAEQLLCVLQGAAVLAQAGRDPAARATAGERQVNASRAWLATILRAS